MADREIDAMTADVEVVGPGGQPIGPLTIKIVRDSKGNIRMSGNGFNPDVAHIAYRLFMLLCEEDVVLRRYARLINHGRPRKLSWRKLTRQQGERAFELYGLGLL